MEVKIESRNVAMEDSWREEIEERSDELNSLHPSLTHTRITLTKSNHHQKGEQVAEAHIVVSLPKRHTLTARKDGPTFEDAIRAAFTAIRTELRRFEDKRSSTAPRPEIP